MDDDAQRPGKQTHDAETGAAPRSPAPRRRSRALVIVVRRGALAGVIGVVLTRAAIRAGRVRDEQWAGDAQVTTTSFPLASPDSMSRCASRI